MVKRWDFSEYANVGHTDDGDWVEYEDYAKLVDLCGRMAEAGRKFVHRGRDSSDLPLRDSILYSNEAYKSLLAAIAEAEEVLK